MSAPGGEPRMLLVGGGGGLVGRAVLREFGSDWQVRSVHRHATPEERRPGVEWVAHDAGRIVEWYPYVRDVDLVVTLAWWRSGSAARFAPLAEGLERLFRAARDAGVRRVLHVSVPDAPDHLERELPYLRYKREVDRVLQTDGPDHSIVRPTMLFGPRDKLVTVMLRTMHRYGRFPMFGDGSYHVSPLAVDDLAAILRHESALGGRRVVGAGGPRRWEYRALTDRMFAALDRAPRYVRFSARGAVRLARFLERLGSSLLYAYEVEWLLDDRLGLPPYEGLDRALRPVEPFLDAEAARWRGLPSGSHG